MSASTISKSNTDFADDIKDKIKHMDDLSLDINLQIKENSPVKLNRGLVSPFDNI